jgi:hypothetical protein
MHLQEVPISRGVFLPDDVASPLRGGSAAAAGSSSGSKGKAAAKGGKASRSVDAIDDEGEEEEGAEKEAEREGQWYLFGTESDGGCCCWC